MLEGNALKCPWLSSIIENVLREVVTFARSRVGKELAGTKFGYFIPEGRRSRKVEDGKWMDDELYRTSGDGKCRFGAPVPLPDADISIASPEEAAQYAKKNR